MLSKLITSKLCIIISILVFSFILGNLTLTSFVVAEGKYTYYGYVPVYMNVTKLVVIGTEDATSFEVMNLVSGKTIIRATVNRMENFTLFLRGPEDNPEDMYFKVVADKRITALLVGGLVFNPGGLGGAGGAFPAHVGMDALYPSTTGGLVGNEFIFMATPRAIYYRCLAFEDAKINLYDAENNELWSADLRRGETTDIPLLGEKTYRVVSTGRIQIQAWGGFAFTYLTDSAGNFRGKNFAGLRIVPGLWYTTLGWIIIVPQEPCTVKVYGLKKDIEKTFTTEDVQTRTFWDLSHQLDNVENRTKMIYITSDGDIAVLFGHGSPIVGPVLSGLGESAYGVLGSDICQLGVRAGKSLRFFAPGSATQQLIGAVLFFPKPTAVSIDNGPETVFPEDSFYTLDRGVHSIEANSTVIVQTLAHGDDTIMGCFLLSESDIELDYEPREIPIAGGGIRIIEYSLYALGLAIVAIIVFFVMKKRAR